MTDSSEDFRTGPVNPSVVVAAAAEVVALSATSFAD